MPPPRRAGRKGTCPYLNLPVFAESDPHNLDASPTWCAKDVGGNCPPRAPMGPEPLCLSGERAEGARRADRSEHTGSLPRFGPRWTRKTLLLLSLYWVGEPGSLKN